MLLGPSGPKLETGLKMSSRGLRPQGPKRSKQSQKSGIFNSFHFFDSFSTLFLTFWAPGPEGPGGGGLIFNSVSNFGPEGPKSISGGIEGSQCTGLVGAPKNMGLGRT